MTETPRSGAASPRSPMHKRILHFFQNHRFAAVCVLFLVPLLCIVSIVAVVLGPGAPGWHWPGDPRRPPPPHHGNSTHHKHHLDETCAFPKRASNDTFELPQCKGNFIGDVDEIAKQVAWMYAPVLHFHPKEQYFLQDVNVWLNESMVYQEDRAPKEYSPEVLYTTVMGEYAQFNAFNSYMSVYRTYEDNLDDKTWQNVLKGAPFDENGHSTAPIYYSAFEQNGNLVLSYQFFYSWNGCTDQIIDVLNITERNYTIESVNYVLCDSGAHEGDWEHVSVAICPQGDVSANQEVFKPEDFKVSQVSYNQHMWNEIYNCENEGECNFYEGNTTHINAYPGLNSHATYSRVYDESVVYWAFVPPVIADLRGLFLVDRTAESDKLFVPRPDNVVRIPRPHELGKHDLMNWVIFKGEWGVRLTNQPRTITCMNGTEYVDCPSNQVFAEVTGILGIEEDSEGETWPRKSPEARTPLARRQGGDHRAYSENDQEMVKSMVEEVDVYRRMGEAGIDPHIVSTLAMLQLQQPPSSSQYSQRNGALVSLDGGDTAAPPLGPPGEDAPPGGKKKHKQRNVLEDALRSLATRTEKSPTGGWMKDFATYWQEGQDAPVNMAPPLNEDDFTFQAESFMARWHGYGSGQSYSTDRTSSADGIHGNGMTSLQKKPHTGAIGRAVTSMRFCPGERVLSYSVVDRERMAHYEHSTSLVLQGVVLLLGLLLFGIFVSLLLLTPTSLRDMHAVMKIHGAKDIIKNPDIRESRGALRTSRSVRSSRISGLGPTRPSVQVTVPNGNDADSTCPTDYGTMVNGDTNRDSGDALYANGAQDEEYNEDGLERQPLLSMTSEEFLEPWPDTLGHWKVKLGHKSSIRVGSQHMWLLLAGSCILMGIVCVLHESMMIFESVGQLSPSPMWTNIKITFAVVLPFIGLANGFCACITILFWGNRYLHPFANRRIQRTYEESLRTVFGVAISIEVVSLSLSVLITGVGIWMSGTREILVDTCARAAVPISNVCLDLSVAGVSKFVCGRDILHFCDEWAAVYLNLFPWGGLLLFVGQSLLLLLTVIALWNNIFYFVLAKL
eukprot:Clim_evm19s220 gene=Clim_evmTU19s220